MIVIELLLRLGLAGVFLVAGVAKLRDRAGAERTVGGVGVPAGLRPPVAFLLSVVELAVAGLLLVPGLGVVGALAAVWLLSLFLVALGVQYVRGVEVPCACFGQIATTPAGVPTLVRNVVLAASALLLLFLVR